MITAILIGLFAFAVSLLTLFSGFGLGTLLLPAFALFLPVQVAVASTAIVHAANSLFKVGLLARHARRDILLRFGLPAIGAAFIGAALLAALSAQKPLASWHFLGRAATVTPIKLIMGILIVGFALFELIPELRKLRAPARWLPLGGALSGFFGGLSGHQGALRAVFLSPLGLSPRAFAATQSVLAFLVDVARLLVYGGALFAVGGEGGVSGVPWVLVGVATLSAFAGAFLGKKMLTKMTIEGLHYLVGSLLLLVGCALASGVV